MAVNQGTERPKVLVGHAVHPGRIRKDILNHERVDVDEANLQQMEGKNRDLLVFKAVRRDLAALAKEDKAVRAVPPLDDI